MLLTKNTEFGIFKQLIICYNDHTIQVVTPSVLLFAPVVHTTGRLFLSYHDMVIISVKSWSGNPVSFLTFYFSENNWLIQENILYRQKSTNKLLPYALYLKRGYFEVKTNTIEIESCDEAKDIIVNQTKFTASGIKWISDIINGFSDLPNVI